VGLKHGALAKRFGADCEQQSHHCGIETRRQVKGQQDNGVQQSHHCGIETHF